MGFQVKQTSGEGGDWVVIPAGIYLGQIVKIEHVPNNFDGMSFEMSFEIENDDETVELKGWTGDKFSRHPKCKLMAWTRAILFNGDEVPMEYNLDTDDLLNRPVQLFVDKLPHINDEGKEVGKNKVDKLIPAPAGSKVKLADVYAPDDSIPF